MRLPSAAAGLVLAAVSLLPARTHAQTPTAPTVRAIEVEGAVAFSRADILRALRMKPGGPLRRTPDAIEDLLENRYELRGFPAAQVQARFDETTGTLAIQVDEGRIASIEIEGVDAGDGARVREALGLEAGTALRDDEVSSGLRRLRDLSEGAFDTVGEPPYEIERGPDGVRVRLKLRRRPVAAGLILFNSLTPAPIYTRVDGWSLPAGADLTVFDHEGFNHLNAYALGAYGFSSDRLHFALGARKPVGSHRLLTLGYEFHDLTDSDDFFRIAGLERWPGTPVYFEAFEDHYNRRGHEAYAFLRPSSRLHLGLSFRADEHQSLGITSGNEDTRPNAPVDEGDMRSLLATARWAWDDALYADWPLERNSYLMRTLQGDLFQRFQGVRAEATLEVADAEALGGDFTFHRVVGQLRGARRLNAYHTIFGRLLLGHASQDVPRQRRFALGGIGTLRGRETKAFARGDDVVLFTAEHAYEPVSPWPALIAFYDGGRIGRDGGGSGWKHDLGVGLAWPPNGRRLVRLDLGFALNREPGEPQAQFTAQVLLPF
jgi:outer membrane protein assembly factor BamA